MESDKTYNLAVIMSSYNGEKYIEEQIESVLNQKTDYNVYLKVLVRDDGSTDNTIKVINSISTKDKRVMLVDNQGRNLGVKGSFFSLLKNVDDYDMVFFSDQDDVWAPEKIDSFMSTALEKDFFSKAKPMGIYSDAWIADAQAKPTAEKMSTKYSWMKDDNRYQFLTFNYRIVGATYAINKTAVRLANEIPTDWIPLINMHDSFIGLLISIYGENIIINRPLIYYRQHGNNLVGAGANNKGLGKKYNQAVMSIRQLVSDNILVADFVEKRGPWTLDREEYKRRRKFLNRYRLLKTRDIADRRNLVRNIKPFLWNRHRLFSLIMLYTLSFDVEGSQL